MCSGSRDLFNFGIAEDSGQMPFPISGSFSGGLLHTKSQDGIPANGHPPEY